MANFTDPQITIVILELIALFTKEKDISPLIFSNPTIIRYVLEKITSEYSNAKGNFLHDKSITDIVRISGLALCRIAANLDEYNCKEFIDELCRPEFDNFTTVMANIPDLIALTAINVDENGNEVGPMFQDLSQL
jgi:hypothetical protein